MKQSKRLTRAKKKARQNEQQRVEKKRGRALGRASVRRVEQIRSEIKTIDEQIATANKKDADIAAEARGAECQNPVNIGSDNRSIES